MADQEGRSDGLAASARIAALRFLSSNFLGPLLAQYSTTAAMSAQDQQFEEQEESQQEEFITEDDALEVEEVYEAEGDEPMDSGDEGEGQGDEGEQMQDGAENLLDNGFDDSFAQFVGHEAAVFAVALNPVDPLVAVSGGEDDLAHLWRTDNGEVIAKLEGHTDSVTSVGFSFDGEMVATGGMDGRVRVWRKIKGTEGFLQWEFLTSLEGPDEVNVSRR